jgi:O-antigen ligase
MNCPRGSAALALGFFACGYPLVTGHLPANGLANAYWVLVLTATAAAAVLFLALSSEPFVWNARSRIFAFSLIVLIGYAVSFLWAIYGVYRPDALFFLPILLGVGAVLLRPESLNWLSRELRISLGVLAGIVVLTTVVSRYHHVTFIGSTFRRTGALTFLACVTLFLLVVCFVRNVRVRRTLIFLLLAGGVFVSGIALWQFYFPEVASGWFYYLRYDDRPAGTMGQTNWFGTYLCLLLPLATTLFIGADSLRSRLMMGGISLLLFSALLVCQTRGAWTGFGVFMIWLAWRQRQAWRRVLSLFLIFLAAGLVLLPARDFKIWNRMLSMQKEVDRLGQGSAAAGTGRLGFWMYGLKHLPPHFILGSGLDTFEEVGLKETPPPPIDKAHSIYIESAVTLGLPGLAAYLYFLWACVRPRGRPGDLIQWGLRASIVTYLIQGIFIHDTIHTWPLVWIIAGLAAVGGAEVSGVSSEASGKCPPSELEDSPAGSPGAGFA